MRETLIELKDVAEKFEELKSKVQFFILRSFLYEYLELSRKPIVSFLAEGEGEEEEVIVEEVAVMVEEEVVMVEEVVVMVEEEVVVVVVEEDLVV